MASFTDPVSLSPYEQTQIVDTGPTVDKSCPVAMTQKERNDNLTDVLNAMTGGKACSQTVDTHSKDKSTMASAYASQQAQVSGFGASASEGFQMGADASDISQQLDNDSSSSGCSDVTINAVTQLFAKEAITCALTSNSNENDFRLYNSYTITIEQEGKSALDLEAERELINSIPVISKPVTDFFSSTGPLIAMLPEADKYKAFKDGLLANDRAYDSFIELVKMLQDNTIQVDNITMNITEKTLFQSKMEDKMVVNEQIRTQYKSALLASAENEIQQQTGYGTLASADARSVIDQYLQDNQQDVDEMIKLNLRKFAVSQGSDGKITIKVKGGLRVKNLMFTSNVEQSLTADALVDSAQQWGKTLASELMSDITTGITQKFKQDGMDTVAKAFGDANAAQIKAIEEGQANKIKAGAAGGGSLLMFGLIFLMMGGGGGGGGGGKGGGIKKILIFIIIAIIIYLVAAYFLKFWPFKKSEKSIVASDIPSEGGLLMDVKRRHVLPGYNPEMSYSKLNKKELSTAHAKAKIIGKNYIF